MASVFLIRVFLGLFQTPMRTLQAQFPRQATPQLFFNCRLLQLDFDVHASRQVQLHQGVNSFISWVNDVHQPLVRTDFELDTAGLIDVR